MVLYNTLMGVAAGVAMVLIPVLGNQIRRRQSVAAQGWALAFAVLGALLTFLGAAMTVTWPLTAKPQVNILFGEPSLFLGVLLLAAAFYLWRYPKSVSELEDDSFEQLLRVLAPVSWLVFALGLVLFACTLAIFEFTAIGAAPPSEPIMGAFSNQPAVENTLLGLIFLAACLGTAPAPLAVRNLDGLAARVAGWSLLVGGAVLTLYSTMNYYTHIGLEVRT